MMISEKQELRMNREMIFEKDMNWERMMFCDNNEISLLKHTLDPPDQIKVVSHWKWE